MPMRDIKKKYTKSDMTIMAWRSQEIAANMDKRQEELTVQQHSRTEQDSVEDTVGRAYQTRASAQATLQPVSAEEAELERRLGPVATKLDEDLNLRKLTGAEAHRYMAALGVQLPVMHRAGKGRGK